MRILFICVALLGMAWGQTNKPVGLKPCNLPPNYFCEDRSRGLWHDENDPPKYWCHKPQTD